MTGNVWVGGANYGTISTGPNATIIQAGVPIPPAGPAQPGTVSLPPQPSALVGRDAELAWLGTEKLQVVQGLGGIGKSALAGHYAATQRGRRNPVWWVHAESTADVEQGLADLSLALQPELATKLVTTRDLAARAVAWLAANPGWLLVLDHVTNRDDVTELLRRIAGRGQLLITSRQDLDWRHVTSSIRTLRPLSDAAARTVLTRRPLSSQDGAEQLCTALGNVPLALDLAAAFLERTRLSPRKYLALLRTPATPAHSQPAVLAAVADIARATLADLGETSDAADLLRVFAWYGEHIPTGPIGAATGDPALAAESIAQLVAANLVTAGPHGSTVTVNPVLQQALRTDPGGGAALAQAVEYLNTAVPSSEEPSTWPRWRELLPHITALASRTAPAADTPPLADLLTAAGLYLHTQGEPATDLLRRARDAYRAARLDVPAATNNLGRAHYVAGELSTAITLYEEVLAVAPEPPDPLAVACANNLAGAYADAGRRAEGIALLERTLHRLPPDHRYLTSVRNNLIKAYLDNGQPDRADALRGSGPSGTEHEVLRAHFARAAYELEHEHPQRTVDILEPVLAGAARLLPGSDPDLQAAEYMLGCAYYEVRRPADAVRILEPLLRRDPLHEDAAEIRDVLALAHEALGAA